jgi:hypothetical protein
LFYRGHAEQHGGDKCETGGQYPEDYLPGEDEPRQKAAEYHHQNQEE